MEGSRQGDHQRYDSLSDYAVRLAEIWASGGNIKRAALLVGHEGTKSYYNALRRLQEFVNKDRSRSDPEYDFLYRFNQQLQSPEWTDQGIYYVKVGQRKQRARRALQERFEKRQRLEIHRKQCKTPIYKLSKIVTDVIERTSGFEMFYQCRKCGLLMRNYLSREFLNWRKEHPELYGDKAGDFVEVRNPYRKLG